MAKVRAKNSSKAKSTRKFAQSGQLDKVIKERRARQQKKSKIENRKALKGRSGSARAGQNAPSGKKNADDAVEDEDDEDVGGFEEDEDDDDQV